MHRDSFFFLFLCIYTQGGPVLKLVNNDYVYMHGIFQNKVGKKKKHGEEDFDRGIFQFTCPILNVHTGFSTGLGKSV